MNLTTITRFKQYAGILGSSQDALLTALLPKISDQIAKHLRRDLVATTYKVWVDGTGSPILRLANWPIMAVYQVSIASMVVGYIENVAANTKRASVSFDGTNLLLMSVANDGTETLTDKPVATSKVLSSLKTAVEAVSGWQVTLDSTDYEGEPSNMLRPLYAAPAYDPDTADLVLPDQQESVKVIADDMIELIHGHSGWATRGGFGGGSIVEGFDASPGIGKGFPSGMANVFVWYKAGYTMPSDASEGTPASDGTLPSGLELIVFQILQDVVSSVGLNSNLQSESISGYSYSLRASANGAVASAIENRAKDLSLYKKVTI